MSEPSDGGKPAEPVASRDEADAGDAPKKPPTPSAAGDKPRVAGDGAAPAVPEIGARLVYPDDGPLSSKVRSIDDWIGRVEQIVLVAMLAAVVLTAASHALLDRFLHTQIPFKEEVIRAGTFAIAMLGAAFASHQIRHLSMDLISRRLTPRARLFLKVVLSLFTIFIVILLVRSGFHVIEEERGFKEEDHLLSSVRIAYLIPIGGGLIILHNLLHTIIDIDYILRRKTPPERMRSAH